MAHLSLVTLIVDDYDRGIEFFTGPMGFELVEDEPAVTSGDGRPKRWVVVRPPGERTGILLAEAGGPTQTARIGDQVAGRVGFFLTADDFDGTYDRLRAAGVPFEEWPRTESYGRVAVFHDPWGNRWDLLSDE